MELKPLDLTRRTDEPPAPEAHGSNKLGKDEFLKLLMAQLGQQDPTSPADSQAFVAQLAQFASLELAQNANSHLEGLLMAQAASHQTSVVGLVGKEVLFRSSELHLEDGRATTVARLGTSAANVTAVITDAQGRTVRTMQLGAREAGTLNVTWDGRDDRGNPLPSGSYRLALSAADADGKPIEVEQRTRARVTGVSFENGVPELLLGDLRVKMTDIVEVNERNVP